MSSEPSEAYVWAWLPGADEPVVAGLLEASGDLIEFTYGSSYLARANAVPLYEPELPLVRGRQSPRAGMSVAGVIADAGPDSWGRRVILARRLRARTRSADPGEPGLLSLLLESGSDRIGALDFQASPDHYVARWNSASLEEMVRAAERLEAGELLSPALEEALLHGSSIGGARPKVLLDDGPRKLIAKLSSRSDPYPVVKAEAVAMELARRVGLDVAHSEVRRCLGHDVLLVERFDRAGNQRRMLVSALTILELDEGIGRYATYHELADRIRARFVRPKAQLRELFSRIVFNICVGNTDDHARNHAAFWDGATLRLTPAYDICPQLRSGGEAVQAMEIGKSGFRYSQLEGTIACAPDYLLEPSEARAIVQHQVEVIRANWSEVADAARLTQLERQQLWQRQVLNPYIFDRDRTP